MKYTLVSAKGDYAEIRSGCARTTPTTYITVSGNGLAGRGMGIGGTYQNWAAVGSQVTMVVAFMPLCGINRVRLEKGKYPTSRFAIFPESGRAEAGDGNLLEQVRAGHNGAGSFAGNLGSVKAARTASVDSHTT